MFRLVSTAAIAHVLNASLIAAVAALHADAGCEDGCDAVGFFQLWSWFSSRAAEPTPPTPSAPRQSLLRLALDDVAERARARLEAGAAEGAAGPGGRESRFSAVDIAFPYASEGFAEGSKSFFSRSVLTRGGRHCVVYGVDSSDTRFEESMAEAGCETHVFECAPSPKETVATAEQHIEFHDWCIGGAHGRAGVDAADLSEKKFFSLAETMEQLGHSSVDILRFNLEGSEWAFLQEEIVLGSSTTPPPAQLIFQLHTSGADPGRAAPSLVEGRGFAEVNRLLLALYDSGYRVVSKEVDADDPLIAELSLVRARHGAQ